MDRHRPCLAFVVPCYNEEEGLPHTIEELARLLCSLKQQGRIDAASFAFYVDDGSRDSTWSIIQKAHERDPYCKGLKLAGNVGHQNALLAGMLEVRESVDCLISLDADLQDDIVAAEEMLDRYAEGAEIVYGVRNDRHTDSEFKRSTAGLFYTLMQKLEVSMVPQHADYRLVSKSALEALSRFGEGNLFLRGIFPSMGFPSAMVEYARKSRLYGETKYPLRRMISFAWQGITSFSSAPLRLAGLFCIGALLLALLQSFFVFISWAKGETVSGWSSLMISMLFLGGIQLFCLTVIGEYLSKIYMEIKHRPRHIVEKKYK